MKKLFLLHSLQQGERWDSIKENTQNSKRKNNLGQKQQKTISCHSFLTFSTLKKNRVYNFLCFWIENSYYPDFVMYDGTPTAAMPKLHNFVRTVLPKDRRNEIMQKINHQLPFLVTKAVTSNPIDDKKKARTSNLSLPDYAIDIDFLELDNNEIAEGLTRIDAEMMRKISRGEFLYKKFENLKKDLPSSDYIKYAERLRKVISPFFPNFFISHLTKIFSSKSSLCGFPLK